jgi:tyrosyl-DNA phosphodiesterase 2
LRARGRTVPVGKFDVASDRWVDAGGVADVERESLTVTTFNVWFSEYYAQDRFQAIARLLSRNPPDVMVFQEVTPEALEVFLTQPWIRVRYRRAEITGAGVGNYGMLMLSRLPLGRVTYTRLPTHLDRGFLTAQLIVNGRPLVITAIHLESGKAASALRARQLGRVFGSLRRAENAIVMGDFNMRDTENAIITAAYRDVWPALRPDEPGFTEDTSINHMRFDSKSKHRHVRFDRVLLKGDCWAATEIDLLGTEPIAAELPRVFPSDHFGVRCRFEPREITPTEPDRRQRFWRF